MNALVKFYIIWIIIYNIGFFYYLVYFHKPVKTLTGIFPTSTFWYIIILSIIGVVNWIVGWKIVNGTEQKISQSREKSIEKGV